MTAKKGPAQQEPLLNTVARKLGHAAGTLTNVAQGLTGNLSALTRGCFDKDTRGRNCGRSVAGESQREKKDSSRREPEAEKCRRRGEAKFCGWQVKWEPSKVHHE